MNNCFSCHNNDAENYKNNIDKCKQIKPSCTKPKKL